MPCPSPGDLPNPGLPHCRWILDCLSHQRSPRIPEWVAYPFTKDLPDPGLEPRSPALQADSYLSYQGSPIAGILIQPQQLRLLKITAEGDHSEARLTSVSREQGFLEGKWRFPQGRLEKAGAFGEKHGLEKGRQGQTLGAVSCVPDIPLGRNPFTLGPSLCIH